MFLLKSNTSGYPSKYLPVNYLLIIHLIVNKSLTDLKFLSPKERLDLPNRKENVKNQFSGAKTGGDEVA